MYLYNLTSKKEPIFNVYTHLKTTRILSKHHNFLWISIVSRLEKSPFANELETRRYIPQP